MILNGSDLSDNATIHWENFGPGEPNNHGRTCEDCVYAHAQARTSLSLAQGAWNDANCNDQSEYICEKIAPTNPLSS